MCLLFHVSFNCVLNYLKDTCYFGLLSFLRFLSSGFRLLSFDVVLLRFGLLDVHIDRITDLACPLFHVENFCNVGNW